MGLFGLTFRQNQDKDNRSNHMFSDEDRQCSLKLRRMNQELKELELQKQKIQAQAEIDELKAVIADMNKGDEPNDNSTDMLLMSILAPILAGKMQNNVQTSPTVNTSITATSKQELTDDELRDIIEQQDKKYIKLAKLTPKELVKRKVMSLAPINENEFERAYQILIAEY